ncbi:hypothetical protein GYMLUDRAFT_62282 [Collybiopsis luxurians FD-317 M1]|uniref:BTB domain-containing protein n=1 Tax=Collybiopsis luxurians FD-317 M1 TaxID=944289 RepID=A0A0D0AZ65_9AGAR|nr:hypothetical protein GYMLUDRAFT_62282 [Collybiopsis luxurians FD-317 M1]
MDIILCQTFQSGGDLTLSSSDKVLFQVDQTNVVLACQSFPFYPLDASGIVQVPIQSNILAIVLHFLYPTRPPPNLTLVPFSTLRQVIATISIWNMPLAREYCIFHIRKFASTHPLELLELVNDSATLLASLAPFLANIPLGVIMSYDVSDLLCIRWARYREKLTCAIHVVKAHLKNSLYPLHEPRILLILGHNGAGLENVTVDDIFQSTLAKIDSMWNIDSHSHSVEVFAEEGTSDSESIQSSIMDVSEYNRLEDKDKNDENEEASHMDEDWSLEAEDENGGNLFGTTTFISSYSMISPRFSSYTISVTKLNSRFWASTKRKLTDKSHEE